MSAIEVAAQPYDPWEWFDHRNPDYARVFRQRAAMLARVRQMKPSERVHLMAYYKSNPATFINDWGMTTDPRLAAEGKITTLPFILFPKQREFVDWVYKLLAMQESGVCDKSRDVGMSWVCVAIAAHLALFTNEINVGFGSRKEEYVDRSDSPKSLFWKLRKFLAMLPPEFRGNFNESRDSAHMRVHIPMTGSTINGEAGDNIGRGDRTLIHFIDESAFLARPQLIDAALSATTNTRIDVSSVNGMANPFAEKRHSWPDYKVLTFHWRDDPRKDDDWYRKQCEELSPLVVAQEIDLDYSASREGVLIPAEWINAAVDLHKVIDMDLSGGRFASFDVADGGRDSNALTIRQGPLLYYGSPWTGRGSTIYKSVVRVANICDTAMAFWCRFDSDGVGAGVAGDGEEINKERKANGLKEIQFVPFHGGAAVVNPDDPVILSATSKGSETRTNKDFFENFKAQGWWNLRLMFEHCYRARNGESYNPAMLLSIQSSGLGRNLAKLIVELNQITFTQSKNGKVMIEKMPEGSKSPNLGDSTMMLYAPIERKHTFF